MVLPVTPPLTSGDVHVWWFELDLEAAQLGVLAACLSDDERERAARFHFERDRHRSTAARGVLRGLLGRYVGCEPRKLRFEYGPQGKPRLRGNPIHFNLAHSDGLGVCAVTIDQPVGVDVELLRADFDFVSVARHSFSPVERAELSALMTTTTAARAFFRCWTLKEAYIKARGGGLSIPLDAFDVPVSESLDAQPVASREAAREAHGWYVRELDFQLNFAAAIAIRTPTPVVHEWHLPRR